MALGLVNYYYYYADKVTLIAAALRRVATKRPPPKWTATKGIEQRYDGAEWDDRSDRFLEMNLATLRHAR